MPTIYKKERQKKSPFVIFIVSCKDPNLRSLHVHSTPTPHKYKIELQRGAVWLVGGWGSHFNISFSLCVIVCAGYFLPFYNIVLRSFVYKTSSALSIAIKFFVL